jgi:hypothetical protein
VTGFERRVFATSRSRVTNFEEFGPVRPLLLRPGMRRWRATIVISSMLGAPAARAQTVEEARREMRIRSGLASPPPAFAPGEREERARQARAQRTFGTS